MPTSQANGQADVYLLPDEDVEEEVLEEEVTGEVLSESFEDLMMK